MGRANGLENGMNDADLTAMMQSTYNNQIAGVLLNQHSHAPAEAKDEMLAMGPGLAFPVCETFA